VDALRRYVIAIDELILLSTFKPVSQLLLQSHFNTPVGNLSESDIIHRDLGLEKFKETPAAAMSKDRPPDQGVWAPRS